MSVCESVEWKSEGAMVVDSACETWEWVGILFFPWEGMRSRGAGRRGRLEASGSLEESDGLGEAGGELVVVVVGFMEDVGGERTSVMVA